MKRHLSNLPIYLACLILALPWLVGSVVDWTISPFEGTPANTDQASLGDDIIRELKENISARSAVEILWGNRFAGGDTGRAREGSARGFYAAACPTVLSNSATDRTGDPNLGAGDDGRICKDSTTGELKVWNGSAWVLAIVNLNGTIDLINTPSFTKSGSDGMDIHDHQERHRITGSNGAWVDAKDGIPFAIQQILSDTVLDGASCSSVSNTAIGSQAFGDAGLACFSISTGLDFTGRTGNSRLFIVANVLVDMPPGATCTLDANIFLDAIGTPLATTQRISLTYSGLTMTPTLFAYVTNVTAATHEVALHLSDSIDNDCNAVQGAMYIFDLGNST